MFMTDNKIDDQSAFINLLVALYLLYLTLRKERESHIQFHRGTKQIISLHIYSKRQLLET